MIFATDSWQKLHRGTSHCRFSITLGKNDQQTTELQLFLPISKALEQKVCDLKSGLDIAFDVEIVMQIRFGQADFCVRQKHSPECAGMFQDENGVARPLVRPHCSTPQAGADLVERATRKNLAQHTTRFLLERSFSGR